jgi:ArsR family transcriptional regulator, arsenate/arsenite/antimonite-responsive transcriptional repressor / arsenate reductase (thioredoxin)
VHLLMKQPLAAHIYSIMIELSAEALRRLQVHAALADAGRLIIVDRLLLGDASPSELHDVVSMSSSLLAHHLAVLEGAGILRRVRSDGDRRRTYLQLIPAALDLLVSSVALPAERVVFVCTQNSARSQLAVAVWNRCSRLPAASAGTQPAARVHPGAVAVAARRGLAMRPRRPRHLDEVVRPTDLIVAVCDSVHEELPAQGARLHWSITDPVGAEGAQAFDRAVDELVARIDQLAPVLGGQPQQRMR